MLHATIGAAEPDKVSRATLIAAYVDSGRQQTAEDATARVGQQRAGDASGGNQRPVREAWTLPERLGTACASRSLYFFSFRRAAQYFRIRAPTAFF